MRRLQGYMSQAQTEIGVPIVARYVKSGGPAQAQAWLRKLRLL